MATHLIGLMSEVLKMSEVKLYYGDCLEILPSIPDGSIDFICTDLPYSVLAKDSEGGKWDKMIPLEPMWEQFLRIAKKNAAIVLFAQGLFTARLIMSQPKLYKYSLVWDKCRISGFLNANKMPLRSHEDIVVFYRSLPTYNPQMVKCEPHQRNHSRGNLVKRKANRCYGTFIDTPSIISDEKFPRSILSFPRPHCNSNHPTEKSVDLCRWLVRTYSNPGEMVLDATMGSGTTGVACVMEDRGFIGIESEEKYMTIAKRRIDEASIGNPTVSIQSDSVSTNTSDKTPSLVQGELF